MSDRALGFWAKTTADGGPGISVFEHMVAVGCVARCLAETTPSLLQRFLIGAAEVGALAALHDLGKITPGFQRKCEAWIIANNLVNIARNGCWDTTTESDHGRASHAAIQDFLIGQGNARSLVRYVAAALGGHHGRLKFLPSSRGIRPPAIRPLSERYSGIDWDGERAAAAAKVWAHFQADRVPESLVGESAAIWWLAGLTTVADWLGSDERYFPPEPGLAVVEPAAMAARCLKDIGLMPPAVVRGLRFEQIFGFQANDMQEVALATINAPGVYVLEAPMGMGKTEAALGAAYHLLESGQANGLYFALPTQATSNRMHTRLDTFLEKIAPEAGTGRLIHGNSWLMRDDLDFRPAASGPRQPGGDDAISGRDWFMSAKRAMLAPFGVGTVDQALLGVIAAKHFFVRHFALAGKVVIIDEVHSYDVYTGTLVRKLIATLEALGCTVIILSATLTAKSRAEIIPEATAEDLPVLQAYPLLSGRRESGVFSPAPVSPPVSRTVTVTFVTTAQAAAEAVLVAGKGGAVLWIADTVDAAQQQYRHFQETVGDSFPVGLLHSRFPFRRREALESEWMERFGKEGSTRCGSILVSTQIVEQSVDLDADLMVSELAPTDMLLQRLGRLWRHERGRRPLDAPCIRIIREKAGDTELRTMAPKAIVASLGGKAFVYEPFVLLRTLTVWQERQTTGVRIPAQVRELLEATYADREDDPDSWQQLADDAFARAMACRQKALSASNIWQPALDDAEGAQTRLSEVESVQMVLCQQITDRKIRLIDGDEVYCTTGLFSINIARAVHRNLVRVPLHHFRGVVACPVLQPYFYGYHCTGLVGADGRVAVEGLKEDIRLAYSDRIGLVISKNMRENL